MVIERGDAARWAEATFGQVDLGDIRRTRRLITIGTALAQAPAGRVTATTSSAAQREGAFRFLANEQFSCDELGDGITAATLARCSGLTYCAVDTSSLSFRDFRKVRDVGTVGRWSQGGRGLYAITMLAADRAAAPVGILGPHFWARTERTHTYKYKAHRSLQTETAHVIAALKRVHTAEASSPGNRQLWFQLDRGFDAWAVFQLARELELLITVRSSSNRRIQTANGVKYLLPTVRRAPIVGEYTVRVPERPNRPARDATLTVRVARVQIVLQVANKRTDVAPVSVIYAQEQGRRGADRLCWMLLTTAEVTDMPGARAVLLGYTTRWLIEDVHRAWKQGWTNVEETQLRRRNSLCKWATLHLAVASRALRLARLARTEPNQSSDAEFSRDEIDAILLLKKQDTTYRIGDTPKLGEMVLLLAELGGYDRYSRKPAGATVIGRALERIASLAAGLRAMREEG
jgi:transposase-like protein